MRGPRGDSRSELYLPYWQFPELGTNVIVKTNGDPAQLTSALRQAVRDVDPNTPVASVATLEAIVAESIDMPRFFAALVASFAALALALALVGIYGLVAYSVGRRTPEIGVRMALGAGERDIFTLVVLDGLKLTAAGVLVGMAGAIGVSLAIRSLLFAVAPLDPLTFSVMTVSLILAATAACILPARRATRIDPMVALKNE
jgi:putative ABC transport system permease protein